MDRWGAAQVFGVAVLLAVAGGAVTLAVSAPEAIPAGTVPLVFLLGAGAAAALAHLRRSERARERALHDARLLASQSRYEQLLGERTQQEQAATEVRRALEAKVALRTAELLALNDRLRAEVAARTSAERALAQHTERTETIFKAMPLSLFIKDADSRITFMNRAAEQQWGVPFAEVRGTRASAWFSQEQLASFVSDDAAVFAGRKLVVIDYRAWHAGLGEERALQVYKKPLYDAAGAPASLVCMTVDVTDRQRADVRLQQSYVQLRRLAAQLETSKQDERRNIALDIHDQLGQNLMALKIDVELLHARTLGRHGLLHARAGATLATIDASIRSARAIINELHPGTLELGLVPALEWLLARLGQRNGVATMLIVTSHPGVPEDVRRNGVVFSIIQQALLSVLRHGGASQLKVTIDHEDGALHVGIGDNGTGLSGAAAAGALQNLSERVVLFGGSLLSDGAQLSIALPAPGDDGSGAALPAALLAPARA